MANSAAGVLLARAQYLLTVFLCRYNFLSVKCTNTRSAVSLILTNANLCPRHWSFIMCSQFIPDPSPRSNLCFDFFNPGSLWLVQLYVSGTMEENHFHVRCSSHSVIVLRFFHATGISKWFVTFFSCWGRSVSLYEYTMFIRFPATGYLRLLTVWGYNK